MNFRDANSAQNIVKQPTHWLRVFNSLLWSNLKLEHTIWERNSCSFFIGSCNHPATYMRPASPCRFDTCARPVWSYIMHYRPILFRPSTSKNRYCMNLLSLECPLKGTNSRVLREFGMKAIEGWFWAHPTFCAKVVYAAEHAERLCGSI
jgi:hypothetical protein